MVFYGSLLNVSIIMHIRKYAHTLPEGPLSNTQTCMDSGPVVVHRETCSVSRFQSLSA